ncbi:hypothetical protein C3L33_10197, partial [Rhododendron williamsianum]
MIQLYLAGTLGAMLVILILLFRTPLRKLVIMGLDRLKRGRGPLVVKTVGGVLFAMLSVTVYNIVEIQRRPIESINPTDQILVARNMLEASYMGPKAEIEKLKNNHNTIEMVLSELKQKPDATDHRLANIEMMISELK